MRVTILDNWDGTAPADTHAIVSYLAKKRLQFEADCLVSFAISMMTNVVGAKGYITKGDIIMADEDKLAGGSVYSFKLPLQFENEFASADALVQRAKVHNEIMENEKKRSALEAELIDLKLQKEIRKQAIVAFANRRLQEENDKLVEESQMSAPKTSVVIFARDDPVNRISQPSTATPVKLTLFSPFPSAAETTSSTEQQSECVDSANVDEVLVATLLTEESGLPVNEQVRTDSAKLQCDTQE